MEKKRLKKPCIKCERIFQPTGKNCRYCEECLEEINIIRTKNMKESLRKKWKKEKQLKKN